MEGVCMYNQVNLILMHHIINIRAVLLLTEAAVVFEIINKHESTGM